MIVIPLSTAFLQAGCEPGDDEMTRDLKFLQWIQERKYQIINTGALVEVPDDLEILLIKEK